MNLNLIELAALNYIHLSKNNYLAIIWPSADKKINYFSNFKNIIFQKKIKLNAQGARNFVTVVYQDHEWLGNIKTAYNGAISKVAKAFQNFFGNPFNFF